MRGNDQDGAGPWSQAAVIVDVPIISPVANSQVAVTTPIITWPHGTRFEFYRLYILAAPATNMKDTRVVADEYFAASDYNRDGIFLKGVCSHGQCKTQTAAELYPIELIPNDVIVSVHVQGLDVAYSTIDFVPDDPLLITNFIIKPLQNVRTTINGAGQGRPALDADVPQLLLEQLTGLTGTFSPDMYRLVSFSENTAYNDLFRCC